MVRLFLFARSCNYGLCNPYFYAQLLLSDTKIAAKQGDRVEKNLILELFKTTNAII